MAKEKDEDMQGPRGAAAQEELQQQNSDKKSLVGGYLQWIIMAVVVVFCAAAGFSLGRLFSGPSAASAQSEITDTQPAAAQAAPRSNPTTSTADSQVTSGWYYDFEPVVANLNEPGVTRYIRVALTLQISNQLDQKKGNALLEERKPLLKSWLTIYLAGQSLEDVRGNRNLRRIQSEILDAFNEKLFPDAKPKIENVLFKEFAVQ